MDYIREELLRQQRALAALMTGRETSEAKHVRAEASGTAITGLEAGAGGVIKRSGWGKGASPAAPGYATADLGREPENTRAAGTDAEKSGETDGTETAEEPESLRGRRAVAAALQERRSGRTEGYAGMLRNTAGDGRVVGDAGISVSEAAVLWGPADLPAGGASADARALSWAFQRDARRYDGGFSLY